RAGALSGADRTPPCSRYSSIWIMSATAPSLVIGHDHAVGQRRRLAGQGVACTHLVVFQRMVDGHFHLALQHLAAAGGTDAGLAGIRSVHVRLDGRLENGLALARHDEGADPTVK